ncbi:hypothetical protein SGPA1_10230 [Streptomyces misionensis JCM 4497]
MDVQRRRHDHRQPVGPVPGRHRQRHRQRHLAGAVDLQRRQQPAVDPLLIPKGPVVSARPALPSAPRRVDDLRSTAPLGP